MPCSSFLGPQILSDGVAVGVASADADADVAAERFRGKETLKRRRLGRGEGLRKGERRRGRFEVGVVRREELFMIAGCLPLTMSFW